MREDGQLKGKKIWSPGRNAKGFGKSLRWEVSLRRKDYGTSPKNECWRMEEPCPEKSATCSGNTRLCTKKTFTPVGCGRICGHRVFTILVEVGDVKTHRSKKEKQHISLLEHFITEGNERAHELAKDGAMMGGGEMAQSRGSTVRQRREEVFAGLQHAASFRCLVEEWRDCEEIKAKAKREVDISWTVEAKTHRMEWCAVASKYRHTRCGRNREHVKMPGKCVSPRWLGKSSDRKP